MCVGAVMQKLYCLSRTQSSVNIKREIITKSKAVLKLGKKSSQWNTIGWSFDFLVIECQILWKSQDKIAFFLKKYHGPKTLIDKKKTFLATTHIK
jgi:hypothetical protein